MFADESISPDKTHEYPRSWWNWANFPSKPAKATFIFWANENGTILRAIYDHISQAIHIADLYPNRLPNDPGLSPSRVPFASNVVLFGLNKLAPGSTMVKEVCYYCICDESFGDAEINGRKIADMFNDKSSTTVDVAANWGKLNKGIIKAAALAFRNGKAPNSISLGGEGVLGITLKGWN